MKPLLVGRDRELEWLQSTSEASSLLLVTGEAGIGKTTLIQRWAGEDSFWISFPRARFGVPGFGLWRLAESDNASAADLRAQLEQSSSFAPPPMAAILAAATRALDGFGKTMLVLDDAQWADELTLTWLAHMSQRPPVPVVLIARSSGGDLKALGDALAPALRAGSLRTLEVGPLSLRAVAELAGDLGGIKTRGRVQSLFADSGGSPLLVQELLGRAGVSRGQRSLAESSTTKLNERSVIQIIVEEELHDLPNNARALIECAALGPQRCQEELMRSATGIAAAPFDKALGEALVSGLLTSVEGRLTFRHELHREAAAAQVPLERARAIHLRWAHALAAAPGSSPTDVADQFLGARVAAEAFEWLERAATEAKDRHDHAGTVKILARALTLSHDDEHRARLVSSVATHSKWSGRATDDLPIVDAALAAMTDERAIASALVSRARMVTLTEHHAERFQNLEAARVRLERLSDEVGLAHCLAEMSVPMGDEISLRERQKLARQALKLAEESGDAVAIGLAAGQLAVLRSLRAERGTAGQWRRAREALRGVGSEEAARVGFRNDVNRIITSLASGDYPSANEVLSSVGDMADPFWSRSFDVLRSLLLWRTGRWSELSHMLPTGDGFLYPDHAALVTTIKAGLDFERRVSPNTAAAESALKTLVDLKDTWAPIAQAQVMRLRHARREPRPHRGLKRVLSLVEGVGWEDVLPVAAESGDVYDELRPLIASLPIRTARARASVALADGIRGLRVPSTSTVDALMDSASIFGDLGEPYLQARSLEIAAKGKSLLGARAGGLRLEAAHIYSEIGAHRSLQKLVRESRGSRALQRYATPTTQRDGVTDGGLTRRESQAVDLASKGLTVREIGAELGVSFYTARSHLDNGRRKLGVPNKRGLVARLAGE